MFETRGVPEKRGVFETRFEPRKRFDPEQRFDPEKRCVSEKRVVLADDHPLFRLGMRALLETEDDIRVVAEATRGEETLQKVVETEPEVLVLDIEMPGMGGLQVARTLRDQGCSTRILVLSAYHDEFYLSEMVALGVAGYFTKEEADRHMVAAVRAVAGGENGWMSPLVSAAVMRMTQQTLTLDRRLLSRREVQVMRHVADGLANKEVAARLKVAKSTVKNHLANIFTKLGARSRVDAVVAAQKLGYLAAPRG